MSTTHIAAEIGSIAPTVLLPGDPLRARHIATMFLDDCREVSARRNLHDFKDRGQCVVVVQRVITRHQGPKPSEKMLQTQIGAGSLVKGVFVKDHSTVPSGA